jgi:hypothetical protein
MAEGFKQVAESYKGKFTNSSDRANQQSLFDLFINKNVSIWLSENTSVRQSQAPQE